MSGYASKIWSEYFFDGLNYFGINRLNYFGINREKIARAKFLPLPGIGDIEQIDVVGSLLNLEKANVDSIIFA